MGTSTLTVQSALSIFQPNGTTNDALSVSYKAITDQIQKAALSLKLKNTDIEGNPMSGSVIVRRLQTAGVQAYGTARAALAGNKIKNNGIQVNLDTPLEIVEEVNKFDLQQYGLADMIGRRATSFGLKFASDLDYRFFNTAVSQGTLYTAPLFSSMADRIEGLIQSVENTKNQNVDGVDRSMINLTLSTEAYGLIKNLIDKLPNPVAGGVSVDTFHGVRIYSNIRQTVQAICMVDGAIAQPVIVIDFATVDIPLSAETAMEMFYKLGTQAVMPDLIKYSTNVEVSA